MEEVRENNEGLGTCSQKKFFRVTPSTTSKSVLLDHGIKVAITINLKVANIIDICAQNEDSSFVRETKDEQATLPFPFAFVYL